MDIYYLLEKSKDILNIDQIYKLRIGSIFKGNIFTNENSRFDLD